MENGSILLTIHRDYLNRLSEGNHTVSVALRGGAYDGRVLTAEIQVSPKPDTSNLPKTGDDGKAAAPAGRSARSARRRLRCLAKNEKPDGVRRKHWKKAGCSAFFRV